MNRRELLQGIGAGVVLGATGLIVPAQAEGVLTLKSIMRAKAALVCIACFDGEVVQTASYVEPEFFNDDWLYDEERVLYWRHIRPITGDQ